MSELENKENKDKSSDSDLEEVEKLLEEEALDDIDSEELRACGE